MLLVTLTVFYALYTTDSEVMARLGSERLYLSVPVVLAGNFAAERLPLVLIRRLAACAFATLALYSGYQALKFGGAA